MKNLFVYIDPSGSFDEETESLVKVQIDNSLELGWAKEDIMLVNNFSYEYNGVKSTVIETEAYCDYMPISTKTTAVNKLFRKGLIGDHLYWVHDPDVYQLEPISEEEIGPADMALCDYGRLVKWSMGSVFFRKNAEDIFYGTQSIMDGTHKLYKRGTGIRETLDERALFNLTTKYEAINKRVTRLNITYNFQCFNIRKNYQAALKPIRAVHFHPFRYRPRLLGDVRLLDWFKGNNKIGVPLVTPRLIGIFDKHGIK